MADRNVCPTDSVSVRLLDIDVESNRLALVDDVGRAAAVQRLGVERAFDRDAVDTGRERLREQGVDLPYGCKYGGCITCAAKLIKGDINQQAQVALNNRQLNDGYIILCVARPKSDCTMEIGVESHDKLYRNPFLDPLKPHELKANIATPLEDAK